MDKIMYIPIDTQNHPFSSLQLVKGLKNLVTQLNESTIQNSIKVPKVFEPTNKKTLETKYNKHPNVLFLPGDCD